jgi:hypothetical protein
MDGDTALVTMLLIPAVGIWALSWYRHPDRVVKREAGRLPFTAIDDVVAGRRVKVKAFLELVGTPLEAPVSGRACAGWSVHVEEDSEAGGASIQASMIGDFALRSRSGAAALVRTTGVAIAPAKVVYEVDEALSRGGFLSGRPSARMVAFLSKHNLSPDRSYLYREGVLAPGEEVTVVGMADREPDPAGGGSDRTAAATRVVFQRQPIWIIDGPARWRFRLS